MAKWILALVVAGLAAGCEDDGPEGGAPGYCDLVVESYDECPTTAELCTPQACGGLDCCYWDADRDYWMHVITDCFDGCAGNVDAPVDAPPRDSCEPGDAQGASALTPHC